MCLSTFDSVCFMRIYEYFEGPLSIIINTLFNEDAYLTIVNLP